MTLAFDATALSAGANDPSVSVPAAASGVRLAVAVITHTDGMGSPQNATYGSSSLTHVTGSPFVETVGGEISGLQVSIMYVGASLPQGTQTCSMDFNGSDTSNIRVFTWTGDADCEEVDSDTFESTSSDGGAVGTLAFGGRDCVAVLAGASGEDDPSSTSPLTDWTLSDEIDAGPLLVIYGRYTGSSTGTTDWGWDQTADDFLGIAAAFDEIQTQRTPTLTLLGVG